MHTMRATTSPFDTNTEEREQWRARIVRALAELSTTPPGTSGPASSGGAGPHEPADAASDR